MPVYRDENGNIIEEKTRQVDPDGSTISTQKTRSDQTHADETPTVPPSRGGSRFDQPTVKSSRPEATPASAERPSADVGAKTVLAGTRKKPAEPGEAAAPATDDPVVGWLVVIDGPGRGNAVALGVGRNSIGRDSSERVSLAFGDMEISRQQHLVITYDHRSRRFFAQPGSGQNLAYIGDEPILGTLELTPFSDISMGSTTVRFVALCGKEFDWSADA